MAKTLYHSAARQLGPVRVTVKSDVLQSKFSKPNAPKPDYVVLEIDGVEWNYSLECPSCGDAFLNAKGETFSVIFDGGGKGKEDTATVTYVGEPGVEAPPAAAKAAPARPAPAPARPAPQPAAAAPARPAAPPPVARPPQSVHHGARVGACLNKAVDYMIAEGVPFDANELYNRTSDMVRIAETLENGHMAPKFSERHGKQ